jgi:hypothetical protein
MRVRDLLNAGRIIKQPPPDAVLFPAEPTPWSDFFVARGRALAAFGRGGRDVAELARLSDEGKKLGLLIALTTIEAAHNELLTSEAS